MAIPTASSSPSAPPAASSSSTDPFFALEGGTEWNAYIGRQSDDDAYADGYIKAAVVLCSAVIDARMMGSRDTLVMPILYNARHGVELSLKLALARLHAMGLGDGVAKQTHDIIALWNQLDAIVFGDATLTRVAADLAPYVASLGQVDGDGQDFRYATRNDGEPSVANHGLVNLKRVAANLDVLKEQLDVLRWRVADLAYERGTRAFTPECSRLDLVEIARTLPPRADWGSPAFETARREIRDRFSLSSNAFSRALTVIQDNREMGAIIGLQFELAHLTDAKILAILDAWSALHPVRAPETGPILGRIVAPMSPAARALIRDRHAQVDTGLLQIIDADALADLETIYYVGRERMFGEHYAGRLAQTKREHAASGDRRGALHHLTAKTNLAQMVAEGVARLGRPALSDTIRAWQPHLFSTR